MIQLTNKTSVALLIALVRQNYGRSWYSVKGDEVILGLHLPTGEVAYKIPAEYEKYLEGTIKVSKPDNLDEATGDDSADRLLEWSKQL